MVPRHPLCVFFARLWIVGITVTILSWTLPGLAQAPKKGAKPEVPRPWMDKNRRPTVGPIWC